MSISLTVECVPVRVEAHSVRSACGIVAAGLGVTPVNELLARDYARIRGEVRPLATPIEHDFAFAVPEAPPPARQKCS